MATDINEEVSNAYNAAKQALNDDLKQNLYNATQARTQAYRQLMNNANARHAMYSGAPAGAKMAYDQSTYLPNIHKMAVTAMEKYDENQEAWDKYMAYVQQLNEQANYYNNLASQAQAQTQAMSKTIAGLTQKPTNKDSVYSDFSGN